MSTDKRKRQKEERTARREAERKAAARRELIRRLSIALGLGAVVALVLLAVSIFSGGESLPSAYAAFRDLPTACGADAPSPASPQAFDAPEEQDLGDSVVTAVITTSCGEITVELDAARFPNTVNSFVFLARQGFYEGTVFHRIVENFVIQGGDPEASGLGGPGYRIPDEFPAEDFEYEPGVVAMANAGRGTTGSQFFIVVGEQAAALPATFNVLGEVRQGFDVLDRISEIPTARQSNSVEQSKPLEAVYIESVTINIGD